MKHHLLLITVLLLTCTVAYAQGQKGRIVDSSGNPVPGAMVLDENNQKWATTDIDGNYTIEAEKGNTLSITCLGYADQRITFDGKNLKFVLTEEALELDEAVAIGYGAVKKKDLTGAVGVVGSQLFEKQSTPNVSQSLQGAIPGLMVTRTSSMPGASADIKIRGITTLSDNNPLILVDGMAVDNIDNVSPNDIDQLTVLKDGASSSIYGARAAAGVILITTKSAREGDLSIDYNGEVSMIQATDWAEYIKEPVSYMTMFNEFKWNDVGNPEGGDYAQFSKEYIENYKANNAMDPYTYPDFDWHSAILKDMSMRQKHVLTAAYGNKIIKTRATAQYEATDGLYQNNDHKRFMARLRNNINVTQWLSADMDFSFKHAIKHNPQTNPIKAANMYPNIYLGTYNDGKLAPGKEGSNTLGSVREGGVNETTNDYLTAKIGVSIKPVKGLDISAAFTPTFTFQKGKDMTNKVPYYDAYDYSLILGYVNGHTSNDLTETRGNTFTAETQVTATYDNCFNNAHYLNVMAGFEQYYYTHEVLHTSSTNMELTFPYMDMANADNVSTDGSASENAYRSYFGRVMYNYKGRYYVQANVRADGSSRFAKDYRWGCFPSGSVGWVMSEEKWLRDVKGIDYLKIRASIGSLGNERIGDYPYQSLMTFTHSVILNASGTVPTSQLTAYQLEYAVEDITWETTFTYDIGVDLAFLNNRLSLSGDYYYKYTKDMLLDVKIPSYTGFGNPSQNAGTMYTNGWEFKIDWKDKVGDFSYGVGFNMSDYKSIMGNLNGTYKLDSDKMIIEGEEYQSWYGYQSSGIFQNEAQITAAPSQLIASIAPGDLGYKDISGPDGVPDGVVSATYDKSILGSSLPHLLYGGYANFSWKGISLTIMFNGVGKQWAHLTEEMVAPFMSSWLGSPAILVGNYWSKYNSTEKNETVKYPRLTASSRTNNYYLSDYWLFDGSYFRIKNINLSYSFPKKWVNTIKMKDLTVYFNCEDPLCASNYPKGWDPEQTASSYIARTYTFGLNIKF